MAKKVFIIVSVFIPLFVSCASLKAGIYLSTVDTVSGKDLLQNESNVRIYLANILQHPDDYTINAYSRRVISYKIPKTRLLVHMYYAIHELNIDFYTLSFYGTDLTFRSEGTWTIDSDADLGSFKNFLTGENKWEVEEFTPENGIDVEKTVLNIIKRIDSNITYYYRDHIKDKPNVDNCITALKETCVKTEPGATGLWD